MTKTEAAEILANFITVYARQCGVRDITALFIAEAISHAQHSAAAEGSPLHTAALLRPSDRTIRAAGRRATR